MMTSHDSEGKAQQMQEYILGLTDFPKITEASEPYGHMGATLTDAVLQAGVNYQHTVVPRVERILDSHKEARTTRAFQALVTKQGAAQILKWKEDVEPGSKPQRLRDLLELLVAEQVETEPELWHWLQQEGHSARLQTIKGVGIKTFHYLQILCGDKNAVAVDVNLRTFFRWAEITVSSDEELAAVIVATAKLKDVSPAALDHALWQYVVSNRGQK